VLLLPMKITSQFVAGCAQCRFPTRAAASIFFADSRDTLAVADTSLTVGVLGNSLAAGEVVTITAADAIGSCVTSRTE